MYHKRIKKKKIKTIKLPGELEDKYELFDSVVVVSKMPRATLNNTERQLR